MTLAIEHPAAAPRQRSVTPRLLRALLPYAARRWPAVAGVAAVTLLQTGLTVLRPWPMKVVVDHVLDGRAMGPGLARLVAALPSADSPRGLLTWAVAATLALFVAGWLAGAAKAVADLTLGQRVRNDLTADLFDHLQRLSLRSHARRPVGDTLVRVTKDTRCVSTVLGDALLPAAGALCSLAAMFAVMWALSPTLTLAALAAVPVMAGAFSLFAGRMERRGLAQQEAEGRAWSVVQRTLGAIPVVQAFGGEPAARRQFDEARAVSIRTQLDLLRAQLGFRALVGLATTLGAAGVLWLGARQVLSGAMTVGTILVFLAYVASLYRPLGAIAYGGSTVHSAAGQARRVLELLDERHDVADAPDAAPMARARGHVAVEGVTFGYDPDRPVLRDVWLEARPGETVAIVGPTGSGKSTLAALLLLRLYDPHQGRVTLDGVDLRRLRLTDARRQVSLVPQEPFLFPVSVRENIAFGRPDATDEQVEAAARAAGADDFIRDLPGGYDAVVGERGGTLSVGQRQRIGIARATLRDAPVLVLDEPTSALDARTEAAVADALRELSRGRTTFVIAHRLSTVRDADRVIVLDAGRVVESGSPADLLAAGGHYARLVRLQEGGGS